MATNFTNKVQPTRTRRSKYLTGGGIAALGAFAALVLGLIAYAAAVLSAVNVSNLEACGESSFTTIAQGDSGALMVTRWDESQVRVTRIGDMIGGGKLFSSPSPRVDVDCVVHSGDGTIVTFASNAGRWIPVASMVASGVVVIASVVLFVTLCRMVWARRSTIWDVQDSDSRGAQVSSGSDTHALRETMTFLGRMCHCLFFAAVTLIMLIGVNAYAMLPSQAGGTCLTSWRGETVLDKDSSPVVSHTAEKTAVLAALEDAVAGDGNATSTADDVTSEQAQALGARYIHPKVNAVGEVQCAYGPGPGASNATVTWPLYDQEQSGLQGSGSGSVLALIGTGLMLAIMAADLTITAATAKSRL
ncbi:hypothetical protein D2E23_2012 [Bifidobacterium callimiconis]|uniref:Uncharacterized protein n=1 Tax=Bifidobacterium callimiconis TaxID=2306973 RepID=A0A430F9K1_9BIFI|nr:hypothetical protein D2E23_2012 [Bifidobacterium callimiconis]